VAPAGPETLPGCLRMTPSSAPLQTANFWFVPVGLQPLAVNIVNVFWKVRLSSISTASRLHLGCASAVPRTVFVRASSPFSTTGATTAATQRRRRAHTPPTHPHGSLHLQRRGAPAFGRGGGSASTSCAETLPHLTSPQGGAGRARGPPEGGAAAAAGLAARDHLPTHSITTF